MDNQKGQTIYVYRYMWLMQGNENMCVKVLSGTLEEQAMFINSLRSSEEVTKAVRVYLHEIDISLIEMYDKIKDIEEVEVNA